MEKPINVVIDDIKAGIYEVLNRDNLPISILCLILNEVCREANLQSKNIIDAERKQYQDSLAESAENKTEEK